MKTHKLPSLSKVKKALYADWALRVKRRDGWKCLLCGCEDNLTAHHWYVCDHHAHAARYCVDNGATLCYACHIRGVHQRADMATISRLFDSLLASAGVINVRVIQALAETELTTPVLRTLWDGMRARVIVCDATYARMRGKKLFLYSKGHQLAVAGNVVRIPEGQFFAGDNEVTAVAKTAEGYRYTLKPLTAEVPS